MNTQECISYCTKEWSEGGSALEGLKKFIEIPNLSPHYDEGYFTNGLMGQAVHFVGEWIKGQGIKGLEITYYEDKGREPLLFVEIPSTAGKEVPAVLTYGHLDKMPHLDAEGWSQGLFATKAVVRGDKVYGRGSNDDGYNPFCIITAVKYLEQNNLPHPRIVMLLESGEESGDDEIQRYLNELRPKIGEVGVIMVVDGEAEDYKTFWCCTSLRGVVMGVLDIQHLAGPCHSGMATGVVPSTFRIARMLLSRIEKEETGEILIKEANIEIPQNRIQNCNDIANQLGAQAVDSVTLLPGAKHLPGTIGDLLVNKAWRPGLAITGADGIPIVANGSNVIRTRTALKLSLRLPPGVKSEEIGEIMKKELERDPPYGAKVSFKLLSTGDGWFGRDFDEKTQTALDSTSQKIFGQKPLLYGEGGSIPLCNALQALWPNAQLIVTGAAGVDSNPHGYDESLDLPYTGKFTASISSFLNEISV